MSAKIGQLTRISGSACVRNPLSPYISLDRRLYSQKRRGKGWGGECFNFIFFALKKYLLFMG